MTENILNAENRSRREIELQAQYSEASKRVELFQNASVNLPGGYHRCSVDEGYPFLFVSKSFEELVGYTAEQLKSELDNKFVNLIFPDDIEVFESFEHDIEKNGSSSTAYRIRRRDGSVRWVQDSTLLIDWEGTQCFQCNISDITEFVEKQETLAKENAEYEALASNIPCGYHRCTTDDGFKVEFASDSFLETVGYERSEVLWKPFIELVAPEDREFFMSHEPKLSSEGKIELAYRLMRKDGSYRWIKDSTMKIKHGGKDSYQCILADITDFVNEQEAMLKRNLELMQKETFMEAMASNMPGGYHRCKAEAGCPFIYIGSHFTDIVGYTVEEIERDFGNLYQNLIWDEDADKMSTYNDMVAMRGNGNNYTTDIYRVKHKNGGYRWVTDSTMFVDLGENSFFQSIISDITEYIEGINQAKKEAEASNNAKSTFLFNASHDIRTPMNAIKGFAHIIKENADNAEIVSETVKKIEQASDTLMTLMNDILDLARIERGKDEVNEKPLNLHEHTKNLYEMFAASMNEAGISFEVKENAEHLTVLADSLKLTRIGMNMLSNAKKFTPAGGSVTFEVNEISSNEGNATYRFTVSDTGIGMSEDFRRRAFEQFERERTSTESGVSGSGLGLAIIKKLALLMGGDVEIESELGKGTSITATLSFPLASKHSTDKKQSGKKEDMHGIRVLLVEDNEFNREIAGYMLREINITVEEAENGLQSVNKILQNGEGYYDLVLMDIQMPVMDGLKATEEIRAIKNKALSSVPIIAMTANAFDEDRERALAAGMNGHIGKPIDIEVLQNEILRVLKGEEIR